ncbi:MAG: lysophospholipid acyltransferase family protein [Planctomycetota bacterium]|jgi:1-acyl-sn-glycerol-3-phosphate acyltransferase
MPLSRLLWRVRTTGRRFHRRDGGLIVAANHSSWLDAYLVQYAVFPHQLTFLMSEVFYDLPLLGLYFRAARARPIRDRSEGRPSVAAIRAALGALEAGEAICIFPEGELTSTGKMREKGQRGIALLARKTGATVLPIGIRGAVDVYSRMQPKLRLSGDIELHIGQPLTYDEQPNRAGENEFTARLMDRLRDLSGQNESPDQPPPSSDAIARSRRSRRRSQPMKTSTAPNQSSARPKSATMT